MHSQLERAAAPARQFGATQPVLFGSALSGRNQFRRSDDTMQPGDPKSAEALLPLVYDELRKLAAYKMANELPGQTLEPTALVHEAWLRLVGNAQLAWQNRAHFFGAAAEAMRRILIESARRKQRLKRGGQMERVDIDAGDLPSPMPDDELLALDEALDRLAVFDARAAQVVKLCFFVGLTQDQAARELGLSASTVERLWAFARAWLFREMQKERNADAGCVSPQWRESRGEG